MNIAFAFIVTPEFEEGLRVLKKSIEYHSPHNYDYIHLDKLDKYADVPIKDEYFRASLSRFELFRESQYKYDRIIYMDADMVCVDDISLLYSEELNDCDIYMAPNHSKLNAHIETPPVIKKRWRRLAWAQQRYGRPIFNAGLMVINKSIFSDKLPDMFIKVLEEGRSYDMADQGAVNEMIYTEDWRLGELSTGFNYLRSYPRRFPDLDVPIKIVHYIGNPKPWQGDKEGWEHLDHLWQIEANR